LALLPFQLLFTQSLCWDQLHAPSLFSSSLSATLPFCCVLVFSSLFIVQDFFVLQEGVNLSRGLCWFILEVAGGILCHTWCPLVHLFNVSQAGLEPESGSAEPSCFLSVTWLGEASMA
jgi:hypothetical protein